MVDSLCSAAGNGVVPGNRPGIEAHCVKGRCHPQGNAGNRVAYGSGVSFRILHLDFQRILAGNQILRHFKLVDALCNADGGDPNAVCDNRTNARPVIVLLLIHTAIQDAQMDGASTCDRNRSAFQVVFERHLIPAGSSAATAGAGERPRGPATTSSPDVRYR